MHNTKTHSLQQMLVLIMLCTTLSAMENPQLPSAPSRPFSAVMKQKKQLIRQLKNMNGNHRYTQRMKLICEAVREGIRPDTIKYGHGQKDTPLWDAILHNDSQSTGFLLDHGANPNASTTLIKEIPILYYARTEPIAQLLLEKGATIPRIPDDSLFHEIFTHDADLNLIELFARYGEDPERLWFDRTVLQRTVLRDNRPDPEYYIVAARKLIIAGASLHTHDGRGLTFMQMVGTQLRQYPECTGYYHLLISAVQSTLEYRQACVKKAVARHLHSPKKPGKIADLVAKLCEETENFNVKSRADEFDACFQSTKRHQHDFGFSIVY